MAHETPKEDAYIELSFSPSVRLVSTVRRFVEEFYAQVLADDESSQRLAMATHELLENAVRYSSDGNTSVRISVRHRPGGCAISIETLNRAAEGNAATVRAAVDAIAKAQNPMTHYTDLMRQAARRTEGSGLGLGRVRAEADMALACRYEGGKVFLTAEAYFPRPQEPAKEMVR